jgi:hypothetical protein
VLKLVAGGFAIVRPVEVPDIRLKRLAHHIDALAEKDEKYLRHLREMSALRRAAAAELHAICRDFVHSINRLLSRSELALDPEQFPETAFHEDNSAHLLQVSVRGRILQISFNATPELVSTEDFRVPYTLAGSVRAFNQELLEKEIIEEQLLFYTVEKEAKMWRFFDPRTYRSGRFDQQYLVSVMEQLI